MATYDAGIVTAYGAAVRGGYTGTYEEFCAQQAGYAQSAAAVEQAKEDVEELIESIPADYSQLSDDVSTLKEDYDDIDDRVTALEGGGSGSGLTEDIKAAMLQIAQKVAYVDAQGQTYYDALYDALYPPADLVSISAVYTQSGTVYDTDTLDSLKADLVVTAHMSDQTTRTVTEYTLSGTLTVGTSTVTVTYGGKTTTFNVTVSEASPLYQLPEIASTTVSTYTGSLINIDDVTAYLDSSSTGKGCYFNNDGTLTNAASGANWFSLSEGDEWVMRLEDITITGNENSANKLTVALKNNSGTTKVSSGDISITQTGDSTMEDIEVSGTVTADTENLNLFVYVHRRMTVNFKFRFYVNGVWYA